jgi:hypothetical protein
VARTTRPGRRSIDRSRTRYRGFGNDDGSTATTRANARETGRTRRNEIFRIVSTRSRSVAGEPASSSSSSSSSRWSRVDPRDRSEFSSNSVRAVFCERRRVTRRMTDGRTTTRVFFSTHAGCRRRRDHARDVLPGFRRHHQARWRQR